MAAIVPAHRCALKRRTFSALRVITIVKGSGKKGVNTVQISILVPIIRLYVKWDRCNSMILRAWRSIVRNVALGLGDPQAFDQGKRVGSDDKQAFTAPIAATPDIFNIDGVRQRFVYSRAIVHNHEKSVKNKTFSTCHAAIITAIWSKLTKIATQFTTLSHIIPSIDMQ